MTKSYEWEYINEDGETLFTINNLNFEEMTLKCSELGWQLIRLVG